MSAFEILYGFPHLQLGIISSSDTAKASVDEFVNERAGMLGLEDDLPHTNVWHG